MILFMLGLIVGSWLGIFIMAIFIAGKRNSEMGNEKGRIDGAQKTGI